MGDAPPTTTSGWPYLDITVRDALITRNSQRETTRIARLLPHKPDATQIPIRLLAVADKKAPPKLTA